MPTTMPERRRAMHVPSNERGATSQPEGPPRRADPVLVAAAAGIAVIGSLTIMVVWALQARGYAPCELCLCERIPFYVGVPTAAALALLARRMSPSVLRIGFALLALAFAVGAALGAYHAGVEWHLWAGPSGCSGIATAPADVADFLRRLDDVMVVRCDVAALRSFGLSLAAWNALLCAGLAATAVIGIRRTRH